MQAPFGGQPGSGGEDRPAGNPAGPDITVESALVTDARRQPGLGEQTIELGAIRRRDEIAYSLKLLRGRVARGWRAVCDGEPDPFD